MLRSIKEVVGYKMRAKDGEIGKVVDFYFDDIKWSIRYMVADTKSWLPGRKVLIAPAAFYDKPDWASKEFPLVLTKEMIKESPDIDTEKPLSRQKEIKLLKYYNWPLYWLQHPLPPEIQEAMEEEIRRASKESDTHLRSFREVLGYQIEASDGPAGRTADFVVDDKEWVIKYIVTDAGSWLKGRKVLISPEWIKKVDWAESKMKVDLSEKEIEGSPFFNPKEPVNRAYEDKLYDYYGRPKNW